MHRKAATRTYLSFYYCYYYYYYALVIGFCSWQSPSFFVQAQPPTPPKPSYANVTLTSQDGDLSVVVFLPSGIKPDEPAYYTASRFDGSSMIGSIQRKVTHADGTKHTHLLYDTDLWRAPHDPGWTESGTGLAAEFGVGDDGAICNYRCGWNAVNDVSNGILGYQRAKSGESFLKIGVGELIKGSCPICDSTDNYRFNSPYAFAKPTEWVMEYEGGAGSNLALHHQAFLDEHGYKLHKEISLKDNILSVQTTLTNLGRIPFSTAWYSHHFFTCDGKTVGPGYSVNLNLTGTGGQYEEPGTWFWSSPLEDYGEERVSPTDVSVVMHRPVESDVKIKAEFVKDGTSDGGFTLHGCGTAIDETIPELSTKNTLSMYGYNLYIESGTFSPEPQILIKLFPGQTETWTQRLVIRDGVGDENHQRRQGNYMQTNVKLTSISSTPTDGPVLLHLPRSMILLTALGVIVVVAAKSSWNRYRRTQQQREGYTPIPNHPIDGDNIIQDHPINEGLA